VTASDQRLYQEKPTILKAGAKWTVDENTYAVSNLHRNPKANAKNNNSN